MKTLEIKVKFVRVKCRDVNEYTYKPVFGEEFEYTNIELKSGVKIRFRCDGYYTVREVNRDKEIIVWLAQGRDMGKQQFVQEIFDSLGVENTNAEEITATFKGKTCLI